MGYGVSRYSMNPRGKSARQICATNLRDKSARQICAANLRDKSAHQICATNLRNKSAEQICGTNLESKSAEQICETYTRHIASGHGVRYRFLHAILGVRFPPTVYEQNMRSLSVECGSRSDSAKRICGTNPWNNYAGQICETSV